MPNWMLQIGDLGHQLAIWAPMLWMNVFVDFVGSIIVCVMGWVLFCALAPELTARFRWTDAIFAGYVIGCAICFAILLFLGLVSWYTMLGVWMSVGIITFSSGLAVLRSRARRPRLSRFAGPTDRHYPDRERVESIVKIALVSVAVLSLGVMPLCVSLTMPVPSWMDLFETNLAPVQRIVSFESYWPPTALPAALYPSNRSVPLYTAFFAFLAKGFGRDATQVISASLLPNLCLTLLSVWCMARFFSGTLAAIIALWFWSLSFNYVHLQDARSTCWCITFAFFAITVTNWYLKDEWKSRSWGLLALAALALGLAILAHPFIGAFVGLTLGIWWIMDTVAVRVSPRLVIFLGAGIIGVLGFGVPWMAVNMGSDPFLKILTDYPVPFSGTVIFILMRLAGRELLRDKAQAALLGLSAFLSLILPIHVLPFLNLSGLHASSMAFELPLKGLHFWLASLMCVLAACGLARVAELLVPKLPIPWTYVLGSLLAMFLSIPQWGSVLGLAQAEEQQAAGIVGGIKRHTALVTNGYFQHWPDTRYATSDGGRELFEWLRQSISCGVITSETRIAHVARELSPWVASPFPAFTGITQDLFLTQPFTPDIHVFQGRIQEVSNSFDKLANYNWVLIEGNEPNIAEIIARLLTGSRGFVVAFQRAGIVLLTTSAPLSVNGC